MSEQIDLKHVPMLVAPGASATYRAVMIASELSLATLDLSARNHFP